MDEPVSSQRTSLKEEAEGSVARLMQTDVTEEHALWTSFAEAKTVEVFCRSWLALQCRMIEGVRAGVVLLGPADRGPFQPVAIWPDDLRHLHHLTTTAERTLSERRGCVLPSAPVDGEPPDGRYEIGYPVAVRGALHGVAVLEITSQSDVERQGMLRQLRWGGGLARTALRAGNGRGRTSHARANSDGP